MLSSSQLIKNRTTPRSTRVTWLRSRILRALAVTHCRLNAGDMVRLNPAAQPQFGHASIAIFFNPHNIA